MAKNKMSKKAIILIVIACILSAFALGLTLGAIGGLVYAWVLDPIECIDGLPPQLEETYQEIYVSLVVDSFSINHDLILVSAYLGTWEDSEIIHLLTKQLDCAVSQEDFERAELIRDILLTYHNPAESNP